MESTNPMGIGAAKVFATTRWSVVATCLHDDEAKAKAALSELCQAYWRSIYACIRHQGYSVHDAQDLTQEFFVHLLQGKWLHHLDAAKGRLRSYLSIAVRNFLAGQHRRRWTLWRNRSAAVISFDVTEAETSYEYLVANQSSPRELYDRQWAATLLEQALNQLRTEMRADGKEMLFEHFDAISAAATHRFAYAELAQTMSMTVGGLHAALYRWRRRLYHLLRDEVARTVVSKAEIDAELDHLLGLIRQ